MYYTSESFIKFYDDMTIAEEGFLDTIKNLFLKLINTLQKFLSKCKDGKIKRRLMRLLDRAKRGLTKTNNIKNEKEAEELKEYANDIQEEMEELKEYVYVKNADTGEVEKISKDEFDKRFNKKSDPIIKKTETKKKDNAKKVRKDEVHSEVKRLADEKDAKGLKFIFVDCLDVDPTFVRYKADFDYVMDNFPEAFEPHEDMTPFESNPKKWTENYWVKIKNDFLKNPSLKRFNEIRKVAKIFYAEKIQRLLKERKEENRNTT